MKPKDSQEIAAKISWVLHLVLIALILIVVRIWHLAVIQREQKVEEASRPQRKVVIEPAKRGTIRDRFNIPLAINKIQYNAAILYGQIRQIPAISWSRDADGNRVRHYKRREYIEKLSHLLADELGQDPERIEDLIHSKGSFFQHVPFVIREDISEKQYYRLKMLEKDWIGLSMQKVPKRHYPKGPIACDIIGYMGAINRQEYDSIIHEMNHLREYIEEEEQVPEEVRDRLKELEELAYTINDYVGKMGVEGRFEQTLRGYHGKRSFYSDAKGNFLRELSGGKEPKSGKRILLTISAELQRFAEHLLIQNEEVRKAKISGMNVIKQEVLSLKEPWIKGGAIVVMDPNNGELLALATHPRFDPNDFILTGNSEIVKKKKSNIGKWFETERYLADIWNQKLPLTREVFRKRVEEEEILLTWETFLDHTLPPFDADGAKHVVRRGLERVETIANAILLQDEVEKLLEFSGQSDPYWLFQLLYEGQSHGPSIPQEVRLALLENLAAHEEEVNQAKKRIAPFLDEIPRDYDKVLLVDLCRLVVSSENFTESLLNEAGEQTLSSYRDVNAAFVAIEEVVQEMARSLFHELHFKEWRQEEGKEFLKEKRQAEKEAKRYAKPFLDYFDAEERGLFSAFWKKNSPVFLKAFLRGEGAEDPDLSLYIEHFQSWHRELMEGAHTAIEWRRPYEILSEALQNFRDPLPLLQTLRHFDELNRPLHGRYRGLRGSLEKHLALSFYPRYGFGYGRSYAYRQALHQGSIFKLVTAYEALIQKYRKFDDEELASLNSAKLNPLEIIDMMKGTGKRTTMGSFADGTPIPQLYKGGRIPKSAVKKIGRVDILRALEYSSNPYFALLTVDVLEDPRDLERAARDFNYGERTGLDLPYEIKGQVPTDLLSNRTGLYAFSMGHHTFVTTPIQTAVMLSSLANGGKVLKPKLIKLTATVDKKILPVPTEVKRELFMPEVVRQTLLEGMHRVWHRAQTEGLASIKALYYKHPKAIKDFLSFDGDLVAKSSTAETVENVNLDAQYGTHKFNHTWFGGISFDQKGDGVVVHDEYGKPELVVVVYLRYGEWGKDGGPVTAQLVNKWRSLTKM